MTVASDLVGQIMAALPASVTPNLTAAAPLWDLYEAYIFGCVVRAAATEGYTILLAHGNGGPLPTSPGGAAQFVFRKGPGVIYSPGFSYATAVLANANVEVHVGVRVDGQSGVAHECDVSVLDAAEATLARTGGFHPRARGVVLACECKYYSVGLPSIYCVSSLA